MSDRVTNWAIVMIMLAAFLGFHFTPWDKMGWWGPLGYGAAYRKKHMIPEGCETPR